MKREKELLDEIALLAELRECQRELGEVVSTNASSAMNNQVRVLRRLIADSDDLIYTRPSEYKFFLMLDGRLMLHPDELRKISEELNNLAAIVEEADRLGKRETELRNRVKEIKKELGIE